MKLFIVNVRYGPSIRYVDSFWIVEEHAVKRIEDLRTSLLMSGKKVGEQEDWNVWSVEGTVTDARLR